MEKVWETIKGGFEFFGPQLGPWILALAIIVVGYFVARIVRSLVCKMLGKTNLDDKLVAIVGGNTEGSERGVASFVYWLMMLFVIIVALNAAGLEDAVDPLKNVLDKIMGSIPNILKAGLILFLAWIIAKVVRNILTGVLTASKVDERLGLEESKPITNGVGAIAFFGIILMMLPNALSALGMEEISKPISDMVNQILQYAPLVFGGIALFAIGYLLANIVGTVIGNLLKSIGADSLPSKLGYKGDDLIGGKSFSSIIGLVVQATILVVLSAQAIKVMKLDFISELAEGIVPGYFNLLVAAIILCVAFFVANLVGQLIKNAFWANIVRIGIIIFLGAVALQKANISNLTNDTFQLAITSAIVAAAFAVGVGGAIALGLGGREKAKSVLESLKK